MKALRRVKILTLKDKEVCDSCGEPATYAVENNKEAECYYDYVCDKHFDESVGDY